MRVDKIHTMLFPECITHDEPCLTNTLFYLYCLWQNNCVQPLLVRFQRSVILWIFILSSSNSESLSAKLLAIKLQTNKQKKRARRNSWNFHNFFFVLQMELLEQINKQINKINDWAHFHPIEQLYKQERATNAAIFNQ